jgi:hypothetical protein
MGQTDSLRVCTVAAKYRRVHLIRYKRRERLNGQILELNPSVNKAQCMRSYAMDDQFSNERPHRMKLIAERCLIQL